MTETGCVDTSDVYTVNNVHIENTKSLAQNISIFPNPTRDVVYIQSPIPVDVIVSTVEGRMMKHINNTKNIKLADLAPGVYLLRLSDKDGNLIKVEKVIKQNN